MSVITAETRIHRQHRLQLQTRRPSVRILDNTAIHLHRAVEHMSAWIPLVRLMLQVEGVVRVMAAVAKVLFVLLPSSSMFPGMDLI